MYLHHKEQIRSSLADSPPTPVQYDPVDDDNYCNGGSEAKHQDGRRTEDH